MQEVICNLQGIMGHLQAVPPTISCDEIVSRLANAVSELEEIDEHNYPSWEDEDE